LAAAASLKGYGPTVSELSIAPDPTRPLAEWLEPSLQDTAGQDPLGFNTITLDRILPQLLPGILQLSERARYFSIYAWLLWQYAERKRPATGKDLDEFIRRREFELCLAIKLCSNCEGQSAIGGRSVSPHLTSGEDPVARGLSIKTAKGGFGLYYRSPMIDLGAVAPTGTPLGPESKPTPIEVLRSNDPRVMALAATFHRAIATSAYYERFERTNDPIPRAVLEALAEHACLCRLEHHHEERDALRALLLEPHDDADPPASAACDARRRAFALFLTLLDDDGDVAFDTGRFWRGVIARFENDPTRADALGETVASWSALAMKECIQEPLCSIWTEFCRTGVTSQPLGGMTASELRSMIRDLADAPELTCDGVALGLTAAEPARAAQGRLIGAAQRLDWEAIRAWTAEQDTAASGLATLLILADRVPDPRVVHPLWGEIAGRRSEHQDGLLGIATLIHGRMADALTIGELMDWVVRRFVLGPHQVIAYSKLPKATFRFSWEESGRLRFFTPGTGGLDRFRPSDDRRQAMSSLSEDLGLWRYDEQDDEARVTNDGRAFVTEVFG
jgi:hypothetical protein